jgi:hypothetical protein
VFLCYQQEETKEHLFNGCHYSQQIWDQGAQIMRKSNQTEAASMTQLRTGTHHLQQPHSKSHLAASTRIHPLANLEGTKQKNFPLPSLPPEATWEKIRSLIKETIRSKSWTEEDLAMQPRGTMHSSKLAAHSNQSTQHQKHKGQQTSPTTWTPPPAHFIKVNFDGASKGNPGPAGYGAVLRNSGEILGLEAGFLGETTNNVAELTGLLRGLQTAMDKGHQRIILEGDSQIIIS